MIFKSDGDETSDYIKNHLIILKVYALNDANVDLTSTVCIEAMLCLLKFYNYHGCSSPVENLL
jgi:hypothetical protein